MSISFYAYQNGNCNGMPYASMTTQRGYHVIYDNGNCNGMPELSVKGALNVCDVLEFMFYLFIYGFHA